MSIETLLNDEIKSEFEELKKIKVGSEEHKASVDALAKLVDRAIEFEKIEAERNEKLLDRGFEEDFKLQQAEDERKDRKLKNGISIASIVVPVVVTVWGTLKSLKFEETGTVTTLMGRGFIQKLLPKK